VVFPPQGELPRFRGRLPIYLVSAGPLLLIVAGLVGIAFGSANERDAARVALIVMAGVGICWLLVIEVMRPSLPLRLSLTSGFLLILGLLGLVSLGWSEADFREGVLIALSPVAYSAIIVVTRAVSQAVPTFGIVWLLLVVSAFAGTVSGAAGVLFELPVWFEFLDGRPRPFGSLGYPPALALIELAAMTALAWAYLRAPSVPSLLAGALLAAGAGIVMISGSRIIMGVSLLVIAAWLTWPGSTLALARGEALSVGLLWLAGGALVAITLWVVNGALGAILVVLGALVVAGVCQRLPLSMPAISDRGRRLRAEYAALGLMVAAVLGFVLVVQVVSPSGEEGVQAQQGFDHGRFTLWSDSIAVAQDRLVLGYGQGSYLLATGSTLEQPVRYGHSLVIDSLVELGIVGALASLGVLIGVLRLFFKHFRDPRAWLAIPMLIGFTLLVFLDWSWHIAVLGGIWAVCIGWLEGLGELSSEGEARDAQPPSKLPQNWTSIRSDWTSPPTPENQSRSQ